MSGRGAWSNTGRGGTLKRNADDTTTPGPYYMLAVAPVVLVGKAAQTALRVPVAPPLDDLAVYYGVKAIQQLINLAGVTPKLSEDGVLGKGSDAGIRAYQTKAGLKVDGSVGPNTMKSLLLPHIKRIGGTVKVGGQERWTVVFGFLTNEGGFDPGAVGTVDEADLGLAQINGRAHPNMTVAQRFDPMVAIQFNLDYLTEALANLNNNLRDAVLSYNLGIGGTRIWIKAGRPRYYSPDSGPLRDTTRYVDNVLNAYKSL